jgi:hypothetical protein
MRYGLVLSLCVVAICCAFAGSASAVPVTWTLHEVVFQDGATASGSFTYDADTNTYSAVNITTTTGPIRTGATYTFVCIAPCVDGGPPSSENAVFLTISPASDQTDLPVLALGFFAPLTNAGAKAIPAFMGEGNCGDATCSTFESPARFAGGLVSTLVVGPIPTLSEWGMILLVLSLLTLGTWQLAGRPALLHVATAGGLVLRTPTRRLLDFVLVGQIVAVVGLGLYGWLIKPLAPQDLIGAMLAGVVLGVLLECWQRGRER